MKPRADKLENIDRYLSGLMEGEELDLFEAKMEQDPAFVMLVDAQRKANELVVGHRLAEVREMMKMDFANGRVKTGSYVGKWTAGLILLAAIGTSIYFYTRTEKVDHKEIASVPVSVSVPSPNPVVRDKQIGPSESLNPSSEIVKKEVTEDKPEVTNSEESVEKGAFITSIEPDPKSSHNVEPKLGIRAKEETLSDTSGSEATSDPDLISSEMGTTKCPEIPPATDLKVVRACEGQSNGSVLITLKESGDNYTYFLHAAGEDTLRSHSGNFSFLKAGIYELIFKDAENGCITTSKNMVKVENKPCVQTRTFSFSLSYNEVLNIPVQKEGKILIFEKSGREVYSAMFNLDGIQWNGLDKTGAAVEPGIYIYIIEYSDGNKEKGDIAVY